MKALKNNVLPSAFECANSLTNVIDALYVLNGKWRLAVILCLIQSAKRFNQIQQTINGISAKVLAKELKDLELNGFIKRQVHASTPITIIYEVTDYSHTLKNVIDELSTWGENHRNKIKESMRISLKADGDSQRI